MTANEAIVALMDQVLSKGFKYKDPKREGVTRTQIPHAYINIPIDYASFPALTLRRISPKAAHAEFTAFFTGMHTLHALEKAGCKFWRKDAYRYYKETHGKTPSYTFEDFEAELPNVDLGMIYPKQMYNFGESEHSRGVNQIQAVLDEIRRNTFGTKRTVTMWNPVDEGNMALTTCHWAFELVTYIDADGDTYLDLVWHQHSVDLLLGLPYNIMYYAYALIYFAAYLNINPGRIIGVLTNVHLYDNQIDAANLLLQRYDSGADSECYGGALRWDKSIQLYMDFQTFVKENTCRVVYYNPLPPIKKVEMLTYSK